MSSIEIKELAECRTRVYKTRSRDRDGPVAHSPKLEGSHIKYAGTGRPESPAHHPLHCIGGGGGVQPHHACHRQALKSPSLLERTGVGGSIAGETSEGQAQILLIQFLVKNQPEKKCVPCTLFATKGDEMGWERVA